MTSLFHSNIQVRAIPIAPGDLIHIFLFFFSNFSLVFATASYQSVRIWSSSKKQELLRIMVPNFAAAAIVFSYDGKSIISAWNDGVIRAFTPLTGKLIYAISNAHNKGFTFFFLSKSIKMSTLFIGCYEKNVYFNS